MTAPTSVRVGVDLVQVSRIAESLKLFGERFLRKTFSTEEIAYATAVPALTAERLAARFAAKEAVIKALGLHASGLAFRDIAVRRLPSGACEMVLRGPAAKAAATLGAGALAVSLSHEGDYAVAVVVTHVREHTRP